MDKIYLDENGYKEYLKEIDIIKEKIKKNNIEISEYLSDDAYGDGWHDNFAFEEARKKEQSLFHELDNKLKGLDRIVVVDKNEGNKVGLNSIVSIKFENEDDIETFCITGGTTSEINDDISKITLNSPLAKAINNKKVNEIFSYEIDSIIITGKIIDIKNK